MKSIKFDNHKIVITYHTEEQAQKVYNWVFYNHEYEQVTLTGNTITFNYQGLRFLDDFIAEIFAKTSEAKTSETITQTTVNNPTTNFKTTTTTTSVAPTNKIFKITYTNERGTIGQYGFGCWQYGRILTINNDLILTLRNSNMDEFEHTLQFEKGEVLIEIGEIRF